MKNLVKSNTMKIYPVFIIGLLLLLALSTPSPAQSVSEAPAAMFLELRTDARSAAMGGIASVTQPGAFAIFDNLSANLFADANIHAGASLSARSSFPAGNLYAAGLFARVGGRGGISLGGRSFGYPLLEIIDQHGNQESSFRPKEMAFDLGYGYMLTTNLSLSLTLRYISSDLGTGPELTKGNALAGDIGLTWLSPLQMMEGASLSLGVMASNLGTKISYNEDSWPLPSAARAGAAIYLPFSGNHRVTGTASLGYRLLPSTFSSFEAGFAAEYNLYRHGFLRAGLHMSDSVKGMGSFPTLGAGVAVSSLRLDIAWWAGVPESDQRNVFHISLSALF